MLYLNNVTQGGQTRFYEDEQRSRMVTDEGGRFRGAEDLVLASVDARQGRAVVFFH